ncbi:MAG: hypothetical protein DSM107014_10925 [Gomphosphaeria aponina SAG 52.96 = DSM 107014]|uniref:Uncharacterized protein n=1 Tax=Gomphosphaeria aponina SAG 52.96 = DSM 107014 TaxID=1521640 RepID=A0A941GUA3_9CHRO|nr:hypothetical protein [Gomphosphaeria aponina SAG 52.96 = DSM 107014]
MRKNKYGSLTLMVIFVSLMIWLWKSTPVVSQPTVKIQIEPPLEQVIPDATLVKFQLQALDASGGIYNDALIGVHISAPRKTPWFTSDFPIVEGTELLALEAYAPKGKLEFEQVLPIRGNYELAVTVTPEVTGSYAPFEQSLKINVPENPVKYRNFAVLAVILLTIGAFSGWILGGDQTIAATEIAPQPVRMLLSGVTLLAIAALLLVNFSAEMAEATSHSHPETGEVISSSPRIEKNETMQLEILGDTKAVVGKLATQTVKITNPSTGEPITDVQINLQSVANESNGLMFAYQAMPDLNGQFTWKEQFFDGAPHIITANVMQLQVSHEIEVEGIAPPLSVRLISLLYFTLIFVVGLSAGFWGKRNTQPIL